MDVRLVAAEFEAGWLFAEQLPATAVALLEDGLDTPHLRQAAGSDQEEPEVQRELFRQALFELGELPLGPEQVGVRLFRLWAQRIVAREVTPLDGARAMWTLEIHYGVRLPDTMSQYGALDEDDFPTSDVEQQYERDILQAAAAWLTANPE